MNTESPPAPAVPDTGSFEIGAVCDMTGISHHVLRMWEKRYGAVQPQRQSNRRRLYSGEDIEKLTLLKALVDRGHGIGSIANLSIGDLKKRLGKSNLSVDPGHTETIPTALFVGQGLSLGRELAAPNGRFEVVAHYPDVEHAIAAKDRPRAQFLVLEWPSLFEQSATHINRTLRVLNADRSVLIYDYASSPALEALNRQRISTIRGPVGLEALEAVLQSLGAAPPVENIKHNPPPARRYDEPTLARAAALSSAIKCECPRHLAQLVMALSRFEDYSADCESLDNEQAELHRYLYDTTGRVRGEMENALAKVIEAESLTAEVHGQDTSKDAG